MGALLIHSIIHALITYLLIGSWSNWLLPLIIFISHFSIDFLKIKMMKDDDTKSFVLDQGLHLSALVIVWYFMFQKTYNYLDLSQIFNNPNIWIIITSYLAILKPSSILLKKFIQRWTPSDQRNEDKDNTSGSSLQSAGCWIGYIERVLILSFIFNGYFEGIGFLLAAKSIFRFGDLKNPSEVKQTEYVLVGTLASFAVASIIGSITLLLIQS